MSKRCDKFERAEKDFYKTPVSAIIPLVPHLPDFFRYTEPCCGEYDLIEGIKELIPGAKCAYWSDLREHDAATHQYRVDKTNFFITNPPWSRDKKSGYLLHMIIENLASQRPTWLLFDADWMHTKQAAPYLEYCVKIVSVGRVSWMENGTSGKDNCAWYLFDKNHYGSTEFCGR